MARTPAERALLGDTPVHRRPRPPRHPPHPSAAIATLTGAQAHIPHVGLEAADWHVVAKNTLVLARIDHEEPYWAEEAARALITSGIAVEITPQLREGIDEEWTWTADQRKAFGNDVKDPQLVVASESSNSSKSDSGSANWKPTNHAFWCTYAEDFTHV
ncbi:hypothetical protein M8I34_20860 [Streptomyces sp. MCA2]|uniref:hypothetical protein n=1 Tax=Streptomyces sp. MCA2 TaxID=2944805 RepID=UPI0020201B92|nr:hypothetical protein [Streptomyces sp. MCA2]MCL7493828.1 hypothetical protein [Streptomyces sp. MCA2]